MALLAELAARRPDRVLFVAGLTSTQLAQGVEFPGLGELLVSDFVNEWDRRDWDHTRQGMEILKGSIWDGFSGQMQAALTG